MNMRDNNLVRGISPKEDLLEEFKSFIIHDLELMLVSRSCECFKDFLNPFVDACA